MDSRHEILSQALDLFAARGYDGVGVQEIVEAAGVTKPTLYHYFGSKRGLLEELLSAHFKVLEARIRSAAEYHGDLPLTLRRLAGAWLQSAREDPTYYRVHLALFFAPSDGEAYRAAAVHNKTLYDLVEEVFRRAAADHGNMKGRHGVYAANFMGMINNCIGLSLNGFLSVDQRVMDRIVHYFEHGIYS
jgi:AcrR family transcriptional regulator